MFGCESHFVVFQSLVEYLQCLPLYVPSSNCLLSNQLRHNVQEGLGRQKRDHLWRTFLERWEGGVENG